MGETYRGHKVARITTPVYVYSDTGQLVSRNPRRACGYCGLANTAEGHDGCLGTLPGVVNACCGHGVKSDAYVVLEGGERLAGPEALEHFRRSLKGPPGIPLNRCEKCQSIKVTAFEPMVVLGLNEEVISAGNEPRLFCSKCCGLDPEEIQQGGDHGNDEAR